MPTTFNKSSSTIEFTCLYNVACDTSFNSLFSCIIEYPSSTSINSKAILNLTWFLNKSNSIYFNPLFIHDSELLYRLSSGLPTSCHHLYQDFLTIKNDITL